MTEFLEPSKPCVRGHFAPLYAKIRRCVECSREYNKRQCRVNKANRAAGHKKWREKNRDYANTRQREYHFKNPERRMVNMAKKVAKDKGLPFDLLHQDIEIPDRCPVLGIPLIFGVGKRTDNSPSLDRIIQEKGYVKGNILVVSWRANRLKQDASIDELCALAVFYSKIATKD